jgi:hypothetical protein
MNALSWLCLATRPLFIEEIVEICATFPGQRPGFQESRRFQRQTHLVEILKDLIAVRPPLDGSPPCPRKNVVKLAHFSVKECLTGTEILESGGADYKVYLTDTEMKSGTTRDTLTPGTNKFIANSCLVYLFHNNSLEKKNEAYCLREYAWNQWAWHGVETNLSTRRQAAIQLFDACVYASNTSPGFTNLHILGLLDWLDKPPQRAAMIQTLESALRNPYFYEEFGTPIERSRNIFENQPLMGPSDIRVLKILPCEYDAPEIRCELVRASLDEGPRYDAISYTWSYEPERSSYIRLNGQPLPVRGKIASILRILRSTNTNSTMRTVWIDGLCIDMQNLPERSSQVGLMARIYRQAKEVAVMLEDDGIDLNALKIMEELSALLYDDSAIHTSMDGLQSALAKYDSQSAWNAILQLFSPTWWGRMWPIQELVLASKATIIYGKTPINFEHIQKVMVKETKAFQLLHKVYKDREPHRKSDFVNNPTLWNRARALGELRLVMLNKGRVELPHLLHASRFSGVTHRPDRVFSVYPLSLIGSELGAAEADMVVDYSLSPERVFTNCSKYLLRKYQNLDSFSYINHYYGDEYFDMPSWASTFMSLTSPNLVASISVNPRPLARPSQILRPLVKGRFQPLDGDDLYAACGDQITAAIDFRVEPICSEDASRELSNLWEVENQLLYLVLEGILVDRIAHTKGLYSHPEPMRLSPYPLIQNAATFFKSVSKDLVTETFWRTIVADQWELGTRNSNELNESLPRGVDELSIAQLETVPSGIDLAKGRGIFSSFKGYLGLGPPDTCAGDFIMVFPGGKVPYILRDVGASVTAICSTESLSALPSGKQGLPDLRLVGEWSVTSNRLQR